jgi:hypothetical protein
MAMVVRRTRAGPPPDAPLKGNEAAARASRGCQSNAAQQDVGGSAIAGGSARSLTVKSDLSRDEPVTEAEVKLIGCLLGDTIAGILNPEQQEDDEQ